LLLKRGVEPLPRRWQHGCPEPAADGPTSNRQNAGATTPENRDIDVTAEEVMGQANRQPVTKVAVLRRLRDAGLDQLPDRRALRGRRFEQVGLMMALALGCAAALPSLRAVEAMTASLLASWRRKSSIRGRISDTKLRDALMSVEVDEARQCIHRQVKAEHRRGRLAPSRLPFGVVAVDGKSLGKLPSWDHPDVQRQHPESGHDYGLGRVHRAHLVSSEATVCVDQRPIPGSSNEVGEVLTFAEQLVAAYGRTSLFEVLTADAGNSCLALGDYLDGRGLGYVLAIKTPNGEVYQEALSRLSWLDEERAETAVTERVNGTFVTWRLYRAQLEASELAWRHARQLVRVERTVTSLNGDIESLGNRYFVTNLPTGRLRGTGWLALVRMHWRCENEGHWTADVVWKEDHRRKPWTTDPQAVYALSMLRMVALNIVAALRSMSRASWSPEPPTWQHVVFRVHAMLVTCQNEPEAEANLA
jgi:hypothetical protein